MEAMWRNTQRWQYFNGGGKQKHSTEHKEAGATREVCFQKKVGAEEYCSADARSFLKGSVDESRDLFFPFQRME